MLRWKRSRASGRWRQLLRPAYALLILSLLLPAGVINAQDPPESTREPPATPPAEAVTPHRTEDGRVVVIVFLKEQPLHEISQEVKAEYEAQFEVLQAQIRTQVPDPWDGESLTEDEEKEAERAASELTAAQQDELDALRTQMDALDTEMRREMLDRAQPRLAASQEDLVQAIEDLGGQVLYRYTIMNGVAAAIPPEGRAAIEARSDVAEVVDDQRMTGHLNVSVPTIEADTWWNAGYTGGAFDVAVVDSGIDNDHPGLSSQIFCENRCLAAAGNPGSDPTVDDVNGHGTHVAGIVASTNGTYTGVAYGLDRVFNCKAAYDIDGSDGGVASMYSSDAMSCADWALISNTTCGDYADTINLSYGGSTSLDDTAFARFWDAVVDDLGIAATISAGNSGPGANTLENPSIAYNVMCVANMDDQDTTSRSDDTIRTSSSRGPTAGGRKKPDITAPGTDIYSANNTWESAIDWVSMSGTSMAAPHVAGAHLLMTNYHGTRPMVQKAILINTADDWGTTGWDSTYGWGYIDLWEAEFNKDDWFRTTISPRPDYDFYYGYLYAGEKATLVWHRRAAYAGASYPGTYYDLSDLDLKLYREDTDALIAYSTSSIDNVEQVQSDGSYPVVIKVDAYSSSFDGTSTETYALATEENFSAANGPAFSVGTSNYSRCVGNQWTVNVTVNNTGDLNAHNVQAGLTVPTGLSLVSGSNPQTLGTITSGAGQTASWVLQADQAGSYSLPVGVSSTSYGESFTASGSFSVNVSATPPAPSLVTPANGSSTCDPTPYFDWSSASGATSYQIQVDNSSSFSSPEINVTISGSSYTPGSAMNPGTYYWRVRGSNTCGDGSWSAVRTFTVLVAPSTAPSLVTPGNGSSTCDTTPDFDWSAVDGATSYRIQVDNNSSFSSPEINVTISGSSYTPSSALAPGTYYWRVRGSNICDDGPWSAVRTFTILAPPSAPSLSTPGDGSSTCDPTPNFDWSAVDGATSYQIQVDNSSSFSSPEINVTTGSSSYTPSSGLAPGTYYWRVRGSNTCGDGPWSAVRTFTVVVPPSSAPGLITPGNGSTTCDTTPTFEWSVVSGATSYRLQVDDDSGFGSPYIDTTTASPNYTPGSAMPPGTYYWRVHGANTCGDGPWSAAWSVTIVVPPSSAPGPITPSNGSSTCDTTPTFEWSAVSGATSYRLQVDDDPGFGSPYIDTTTASPNHTPGLAMHPGTYYWRVRGSNTCGEGPWSAAWSVTLVVPPSAPGLVAPANGSSTCDTTPTFAWSAVSGATSYRLQVDNDPGFGSPYIDTTTTSSEYTPASVLPPGTYYWRVRGSNSCGDGAWSASWSFSIVVPPSAAPGLITPSNGSSTCDTTPDFDWSPVGGATSYRIQVDDDPGFGSPYIDTTSANSDYTPGLAMHPGTYYWRVRGANSCGEGPWTADWSVTVVVPPSAAPGLTTPSNGSSTCDTTPTFEWSSVSGATSYQIQVDDDPGFGSPEIDTTTASPNYTPGSAMPPGTYYWRVRGANTCGDGPWSAAWSVAVVVTPSTAPGLTAPSSGSSTCDTTPTFEWSAVSGATSYRIQVDDDPGFGSPEIDTTTASLNYTPGSALAPGTYYWRVRGANSCGNGPWSTAWSLTVMIPPLAPGLVAPSNGSNTCDATPAFEWSAVSGATSYQIQVDDDPGFGSPEIDASSGSPNYTPGSALTPDIYYWRVRGSNTCGNGPWSTAWSLTVRIPPLAPGLVAPSNGSSTCDTTPGFDWSPVGGATSYQIQVDDDPVFGSPYIDTTSATSEFTPGAALPGGTYHWRVRGSNTCGYGSWSTDWTITVVVPPLAPNPILPANGASTTDTTPDLDWSSVSGATSYRLQVADNPAFTPTAIDTTTTDSEYTPTLPLPLGWYYWRVRGSNSCEDGPWSPLYGYWIVTRLYLPVIIRSYP